jgi:hypothetical protein
MDVAAENATELPRLGRPRMKLNVHASQTSTKANKKSSALPIRESKDTMEGRTGTNRGMPSAIDIMQELGAWDRAVATKSIHDLQIRRHGKGAAQRAIAKRERQHKSIGRWAHPHLQKNIAPITITHQKPSSAPPSYQPSQETLLTIRTIAPFFPTMSRKICVTG